VETIYTLRDPRDGRAVYAGRTKRPARRAKEHANPVNPHTPTPRRKWTQELADAGLSPEFRVEKIVPAKRAKEEERAAIDSLTEQGDCEFNIAGARGKPGMRVSTNVYLTEDVRRRISICAMLAGKQLSDVAGDILDAHLPRYEIRELGKD
jgi:hypothetical protein